MSNAPPRILAIAGSDSSGGAGIQADIKAVTMMGGYTMTAITAITAQNTIGVQQAEMLGPDLLFAQIESCLSDIGADAIKIGMIGSAQNADAIYQAIKPHDVPVVFDPVMVATSGALLADDATRDAFHNLMAISTVVTPNLAELGALAGLDVAPETEAEILAAARPLAERHHCAVLAKGGHGAGDMLTDFLVQPDGTVEHFSAARIDSDQTHGTGCTLSSAIATRLGAGDDLDAAVRVARDFVRLAIHSAPGFGAGSGPMGHQSVRLDCVDEPRFNQATLPANDYAESVAFYRALSLTLIVDSPTNGYARFETAGGATLSISTGYSEVGSAAIYLECFDVDASAEKLAARGIPCPAPQDKSWRWRESWITDPAGNRICLYQAGEDRRYPPWRV